VTRIAPSSWVFVTNPVAFFVLMTLPRLSRQASDWSASPVAPVD